jgi:glycosyltransferase involved in cell wall biosynthesis
MMGSDFYGSASKLMHIGIIHPCFGIFGGAERAVLALIREFLEAEQKVTLVTAFFPKEDLEMLRGSGESFQLIEVAPRWLQPPKRGEPLFSRYFWHFLNAIKIVMVDASEFDILHPYVFPSIYSAAVLKMVHRKRVVWFCMEPPALVYPPASIYNRMDVCKKFLWLMLAASLRPFDKLTAKFVDKIVANSDYSSKIIGRTYNKEVGYVHLGVDVDDFRPGLDCEELKTRLGYSEDDKIIVCPGPFRPPKYVELAVRALPLIHDEISNARLILVDSGYLGKDYITLAEKLGVSGLIKIVEARSRDMPLYYSLASVIVHPSFGEPFGLVPLEAMACGKPVVASRIGGTVEIVKDGSSGFLVKNTPKAFADAVVKLLVDEELSKRFGIEGRRIAIADFTWDKVAAKLLRIIHATLEGNPEG